MKLQEEIDKATEMLKGKEVAKVLRNRAKEICIEFTDGTRLSLDAKTH